MRCRQRISRLRYVLPGAFFAIPLFYTFRFFLPTLPLSSQGYGSVTVYLRIQTTIASAMLGKMSIPWRLHRKRNSFITLGFIVSKGGWDSRSSPAQAMSHAFIACSNPVSYTHLTLP